MGKARLEFYLKEDVQKRFLMEMKLYSIDNDPRFPDGAKYSLIFLNKKTGERVLFDNHHPKGHHYHLDEMEYAYDFSDVSTLIEDFKRTIYQKFGVKL